ncbi:hypothetical protein GOV12_01365 [Candidatus Pacearchaeota archaeon]|nr:hypothetical protein [Candidatus Pacearchaeota archaeon]
MGKTLEQIGIKEGNIQSDPYSPLYKVSEFIGATCYYNHFVAPILKGMQIAPHFNAGPANDSYFYLI